MKGFLLFLLVILPCCAPAQNIEGQIVASQFGEYKVQNEGNGFVFDPANCSVSAGGKNFAAFSTGTPVKIVDSNPAHTEITTATGAFITGSYCAVSLPTSYPHTSFYLTSGTGGLQEAIANSAARAGGPNTIILNAEWYTLIQPRSAAAVIGSVSNGSGFGLVDVTTAPYTSYAWSGSQFVQATVPGGSPTGAASGALSGTYPNPGLSNSLALPTATTATTQSNGDNSTKVATDAFVQGAVPAVTPARFGAYGDAIRVQAGCNATASSATVTCNGTSFTSGDVGKQFWIPGAGAAAVAEQTTISSVTNSTTVVVATAATTTSSGAEVIYGHDDAAALQSCFSYSSTNQVPCVLNVGGTNKGYLEGSSGLQIMTQMQVTGNSYTQGTNIWCEYNGDCLSLAPGPDTGVNISNLEIWADGTQPNSRGINLNAATGQGLGFGGLFNANINNVQVENMAKECLWLNGGGGAGYTFNLPNQYVTFNQFNCNGPIQQHNANLVLMTGQNAQISFFGGAVNGVVNTAVNQTQLQLWLSYYPNPLIAIQNKTAGMNDAPEDVKFFGYTYEVGTQGLSVAFATNIHYENSYVENIGTPLIVANSGSVTYNGNHIANSGFNTAVMEFGGNAQVSVRDNNLTSSGGIFTTVAWATCSNSNMVDFVNNVSAVLTTLGCATNQQSITSSTLTVAGATEFMNASATPVSTIVAPNVQPGKTLTLYAGGTFTLTSGGNINFGGIPAPLTVPAGQSVTLTLYDLGPTWLVTATTVGGTAFSAVTAGTNTAALLVGAGGSLGVTGSGTIAATTAAGLTGGALGSAPYQSAANTSAFIASPTTSGHTFAYVWQPSGSAIAPTAYDLASFVATTATNLGGTGVDYAPYQSAAATTGYITAPTTSGHTFVYAWQPSGTAVAPAALDFSTYLASPPAIGGTTPNSANFTSVTTTGVQTAAGFNLQSGAAGPYSAFFDDFYTGANMASVSIGSPTGSSCSPSNTFTDNNHPGNMLLTSGTGGTGSGILCGMVSQSPSITIANTSQGWTWETAVYVPVLPGTTVGAYQAGMAHTPNANPWTTGIGFYLSSANGVVNDWYCRYNSTSTDSGVAATVAWTRIGMVNDGANVHWYIGGTQVCGTGVAIANLPSTTQYPAVWSATALSATSVTMAYDYINWQRAVAR